MSPAVMSPPVIRSAKSLYASVPERERADDLFLDYLGFLDRRNGGVEGEDSFHLREAAMEDMAQWEGHYSGKVDGERFNRLYAKYSPSADISQDELALLAFAKVNAGEAYGVEVTSKARAHLMSRPEPIFRVERILAKEETFHTQILVGAAQHFEGLQVTGAWSPPMPLRVLIFCLAKFPPSLFHPVLLAAEISGVYTFNWLLQRLSTLFPNDPKIRESMERRLIEILIDEVGHVAYNRLAVGPKGLQFAKAMGARVLEGNAINTPEIPALGMDLNVRRQIANFDFADLPEEVRRKAWFV